MRAGNTRSTVRKYSILFRTLSLVCPFAPSWQRGNRKAERGENREEKGERRDQRPESRAQRAESTEHTAESTQMRSMVQRYSLPSRTLSLVCSFAPS
jgi:hypothetical protein